jgi:tetratricopeptide (TPR) repeat protein
MMRPCFFILALVAVLALAPRTVRAHADLLIQIEEATREIAKNPKDPERYLKRGELYRAHVEWEAAYADYERALALNPGMTGIDLYRGRLFVEAGWPLSARASLDRFLRQHSTHANALILRARALVRLNLGLAAAQDYDQAIALSPEPSPDLFVERAQVLTAEGPEHYAAAVRGLDDGIQKLGSLVTLQVFAIDIELKQRNFDGAIARIDKIAEKSPRKETWLARRAEVLVQAGRTAEAAKTYKAALAALQSLPASRRNVPAMQELERRIRREVAALNLP